MVMFRRRKDRPSVSRYVPSNLDHFTPDEVMLFLEASLMGASRRIGEYRTSTTDGKMALLAWMASDLESALVACGNLQNRVSSPKA
jgi:hypothetical protein